MYAALAGIVRFLVELFRAPPPSGAPRSSSSGQHPAPADQGGGVVEIAVDGRAHAGILDLEASDVPSAAVARCTCPMEAAASGCVSNPLK
jgi:hypothetical protein